MSQIEVRIALQASGDAVPTFNVLRRENTGYDPTPNLLDINGVGTGVSVSGIDQWNSSVALSSPGATTGNAAWVSQAALSEGIGTGSTANIYRPLQFDNLPDGAVVTVEVFATNATVDRVALARVNGGTSQSLDVLGNTSQVMSFTATATSGTVLLECAKGVRDSGHTHFQAVRLLWEDTSPALTLTGDLQPGASFTVNYVNFTGVPVSPVTLTDSNSNSITVPVTITDNGDGTGTATGTMPDLPSSGSVQGLKFGTVTMELSA